MDVCSTHARSLVLSGQCLRVGCVRWPQGQKYSRQKKKEKGKAAFGWDVFNQDTLYKAYKKRLNHLPEGGTVASVAETRAAITAAGGNAVSHSTETAMARIDDDLAYGTAPVAASDAGATT